ncbi:hypothetical protein AB8Q18_10245 [Neisseriaceae bacterium CLB008]
MILTPLINNPSNSSEAVFGFLHTALSIGLVIPEDVILWADAQILKQNVPDIVLIELSLCDISTPQKMLFILDDYLNYDTSACPIRAFFCYFHHTYTTAAHTTQEVDRYLWQLRNLPTITETELEFIYWLNDAIDLHNYHSIDFQQALQHFLQLYQNYTLDHHEQWPEFDKQINLALSNNQHLRDIT